MSALLAKLPAGSRSPSPRPTAASSPSSCRGPAGRELRGAAPSAAAAQPVAARRRGQTVMASSAAQCAAGTRSRSARPTAAASRSSCRRASRRARASRCRSDPTDAPRSRRRPGPAAAPAWAAGRRARRSAARRPRRRTRRRRRRPTRWRPRSPRARRARRAAAAAPMRAARTPSSRRGWPRRSAAARAGRGRAAAAAPALRAAQPSYERMAAAIEEPRGAAGTRRPPAPARDANAVVRGEDRRGGPHSAAEDEERRPGRFAARHRAMPRRRRTPRGPEAWFTHWNGGEGLLDKQEPAEALVGTFGCGRPAALLRHLRRGRRALADLRPRARRRHLEEGVQRAQHRPRRHAARVAPL